VGVGLSETFELGGKRGARVRAAQAQKTLAEAEVEEFIRQLRANAANAFIDAVAARQALEQQRRSLASLERLVTVNEERVKAGDLGEIALIKTRVEAGQFKSDVLTAEGELAAAQYALTLFMGHTQGTAGILPDPQGDLNIPARELSAEALLQAAKKQRPDLIARRLSIRAASASVDLASANRSIDLNAGIGWQHNWPGKNAFTQPNYDSISATLTVPLPLSRMYPGELQAARASAEQAKLLLGSAELRVEVELKQALARYHAAVARVELYSGGTVAEADRVFEASVYNYQRGGATLLEVLDAQRTRNDVYLSYLDALRAHARALVDVQTAAGQWDLAL
jgi:cobalt-zinc-cadmium efflux system outer membrane protein